MFICQLSKNEQFGYYKRIKKALLVDGVYSFENLEMAMNSRIEDLDGLLAE